MSVPKLQSVSLPLAKRRESVYKCADNVLADVWGVGKGGGGEGIEEGLGWGGVGEGRVGKGGEGGGWGWGRGGEEGGGGTYHCIRTPRKKPVSNTFTAVFIISDTKQTIPINSGDYTVIG